MEVLGFNELNFIIFLVCVLVLYYIPWSRGIQPHILIASSLVFFGMGAGWDLSILLLSILVNSFIVSWLLCSHRSTWIMAVGVVFNLALLSFFKYMGMMSGLIGDFACISAIALPVGISFFSFEGVSLVVDAWKGQLGRDWESRSTKDKVVFVSLFVSFFPHLVSGPILKAGLFIPQISTKRWVDIPWFFVFKCLVVGYFLKMFVADNLNEVTGYMVLSHVRSSALLLILLIAYSCQIFSDFSGYSLVAIGLASLFGYSFPFNFIYPYVSVSFSEFWSRWHISLSSWLREYLYVPLGGNRLGAFRTYLNLMIVMALGGLWHGAEWKFVWWGCWHGFALVLERWLGWNRALENRSGWLRVARWLLVYSVVCLGWLAFRLDDWAQVVLFLTSLLSNWAVETDRIVFGKAVVLITPVVLMHAWHVVRMRFGQRFRSVVEVVSLSVMLSCVVLGFGPSNRFIYFQF